MVTARPLERSSAFDHRHQFHAVVGGSGFAAANSFSWSPLRRIAPQPPGPGLPEQAPSVKISTRRSRQSPYSPALLHLAVEAQLLEIFARVLGPHQGVGVGIQPVDRAASAGSAAPRRAPGPARRLDLLGRSSRRDPRDSR